VKYSIVILNYNVKHFVDACLQSLQDTIAGKDAEIIVADNASTDGSRSFFKNKYPNVKFLWFEQNYGFAKAYNKAVAHAQGKYLLILNPDTLVSENLLDKLQNFADNHPDFGIIGGKMIDGTGNFLPESKRGIPTPLTALGKLTKLSKILNFKPFNQYYAPHLTPDQSGEVPILTGAFMFIKRKTYIDAGGFDERYFMYGEDIDLSYTILQSGKKNYYLSKAKIIHFKGESSQKDKAYLTNFFNTTFQFYRKHFRSFPPQEFLMKIFFKIWLLLHKKKKKKKMKISYNSICFAGQKKHFALIKKHFPQATHIDRIPNDIKPKNLIIFDTSLFKFSQIIETMENNPAYYRFYFPTSKTLLGSDYKDQIGSILQV